MRDRGLTSDLDAHRAPRREEATLDTLSPREIQSRIRSGATVAELAEESGMDPSAIERFSGPPLAERAWVCDQARACVVRPGTDDLDTLVRRHLHRDGQDLTWDSWRRADGRWTVVAAIGEDSPVSTWVYDTRSRSIHPEDAASHRLASEDVVVPLRPSPTATASAPTDVPAIEHPEAAASPESTAAPAAAPSITSDEDGDTPTAPGPDDNTAEPAKPATDAGRAKSRKSRRASVPRWDEILFGAGQSDT